MELRLSGTSRLQLMGNIVRAASPSMFGEVDCAGGGTIEFNGNSPQIVAQDAGNGGDQVYYQTVIFNNTSGTYPQLTMQGLATIHSSIVFTDGVLATTSGNILVIADAAGATGASDASYVDGPVRKVGNDIFIFPVGDDNNYQPILIATPALNTDAFEAQYFESDPGPSYNPGLRAAGIDHVSSCEYWILNRTAGTSNVFVGLTWDPNSCGVTNLSELLVARWNGSFWVNHGNGGTAGNTTTGLILTSAMVTAFSPFTLGSSSAGSNPLPVELTEFSAARMLDEVKLEWRTVLELNSDRFEVERSADGTEWETVTSKKALGFNSGLTSYDAVDAEPYKSTSYYRLKSIDLDGTFSYSKIVTIGDERTLDVKTYPNPATTEFYLEGAGIDRAELTLISATGQMLELKRPVAEGNKIRLNTSALEEGVYFLKVMKDGRMRTETLVIRRAD